MQELTDKEKQNALNEVRILASIKHPNIVSYKEAFIDDASSTLWYYFLDLNLKFSHGICSKWRFICRDC